MFVTRYWRLTALLLLLLLLPLLSQAAQLNNPNTGGTPAGTIDGALQIDWRGTIALNSATNNAAATVQVNGGQRVVSFQVTGLTASTATLTPEYSVDAGVTWNADTVAAGALGASALTADGVITVSAAGRTGVRLRVSSTGSGSITVAYTASLAQASLPGTIPGSIATAAKPINWTSPPAAQSVTVSATIVAAGPTTSIITNATAAGGGTLTLNLSGGAAVDNAGIPILPGASVVIAGQPTSKAITGKCSTGTCTVSVQSGS